MESLIERTRTRVSGGMTSESSFRGEFKSSLGGGTVGDTGLINLLAAADAGRDAVLLRFPCPASPFSFTKESLLGAVVPECERLVVANLADPGLEPTLLPLLPDPASPFPLIRCVGNLVDVCERSVLDRYDDF